jgi:hypothetical protein
VESNPPDPLVPELRQAELSLESALSEACVTKPATKAAAEADTSELIRVDELLEAASDAAKRAISLRRRRRVDKTKRDTGRSAMGDVEEKASPGAAHRVFTDPRGVEWDVFPVYPEARLSVHSQLKGTYPQGWLCFDAAGEKRRLSPIPEGWQERSDEQLAQLLESADVALSRRGRGHGRTDREQSPPSE